jgi:hypothetical protein
LEVVFSQKVSSFQSSLRAKLFFARKAVLCAPLKISIKSVSFIGGFYQIKNVKKRSAKRKKRNT